MPKVKRDQEADGEPEETQIWSDFIECDCRKEGDDQEEYREFGRDPGIRRIFRPATLAPLLAFPNKEHDVFEFFLEHTLIRQVHKNGKSLDELAEFDAASLIRSFFHGVTCLAIKGRTVHCPNIGAPNASLEDRPGVTGAEVPPQECLPHPVFDLDRRTLEGDGRFLLHGLYSKPVNWKPLLVGLGMVFCSLALGTQTASETDTMLRWAAGGLDRDASPHYLKSVSRENAVRVLQPVLKTEPSNTSGYFLAAWVLACKGIELSSNTQRVLRPALIWKENSTRDFTPTHGLAPDAVLLEDVPQALFLIVKSQRYQPALRALVTMPSDGAVAENQDDCLMDLLKQEPVTVMRLAATDKSIYRKLVDTVDWNVGPPASRKAFLSTLGATRWPNPKVRSTAVAFIRALRTPIHRDYGIHPPSLSR